MDRLDELETLPKNETESTSSPNGEASPGGAGSADVPERAGAGLVASSDQEEIRRIDIPDEDRLAFRVGVNLITLMVLVVGVWWLWRTLRVAGFQLFP